MSSTLTAPWRVRRLPDRRRLVVLAAGALLAISVIADLWSIAHHLPYSFGGHGDPDKVGRQWVANGTELGPPLLPMVVLVVATPLARVRRWWGRVGDVLLALVAAATLVDVFGEPSTRTVFESGSFAPVPAVIRVVTVVAASTLLLVAIAALRPGRHRDVSA